MTKAVATTSGHWDATQTEPELTVRSLIPLCVLVQSHDTLPLSFSRPGA